MGYRASGVALPIFSLPSPYGIGTIGKEARDFIDFLADSGFTYWSILPLGPTSFGDSPFQCFSSKALNHYFIDFDDLIANGLLKRQDLAALDWSDDVTKVDYHRIYTNKTKVLKKAFSRFKRVISDYQRGYTSFLRRNEFLDYACFMVLKELNGGKPWSSFQDGYDEYSLKGFKKIKHQYWDKVEFYLWTQYIFLKQWNALKSYAASKGVKIIGEMAFYVSYDSIDAYKHHRTFQLNQHHQMEKVGGYPPDNFSPTGQVWGAPLYDFDYLAKHDFRFLKSRLNFMLELYDKVILNHFRGFFQYYALDADAKDGLNGTFLDGPGRSISEVLDCYDQKKLIAEHIGYKDENLESFLEEERVADISDLEFSLTGDEGFLLPEEYTYETILYSTRHDNEPLASYLASLPDDKLQKFESILQKSSYRLGVKYKGGNIKDLVDCSLEVGLASASKIVIINFSDLLSLGHEARINTPNTVGSNWTYRIKKDDLTSSLVDKFNALNRFYGR